MDPFSQAALGAITAQTIGGRRLGQRAAVYGAIIGALPDIDVLFSVGGDYLDQLVSHRGITHSLFFVALAGPVLGWLIWQRERLRHPAVGPAGQARTRNRWVLAATLALLSHPLLDLLTPYGTQLLQPFSNARFAINAMPIIDPVYSLLLLIGLVALFLPRLRNNPEARTWPLAGIAAATLLASTVYLGYGWVQNLRTEAEASRQLHAQGIRPTQLAAFPTLLQVHLRRVVARTEHSDLVGYYSTWAPCTIDWSEAPRLPQTRYQKFLDTREGRIFHWFTMGWTHFRTTVENAVEILEATDLRYGFSSDPFASVFMLRVPLDATGTPIGPVQAGRTLPGDPRAALLRLVVDTYAPACRLEAERAPARGMLHNAPDEFE